MRTAGCEPRREAMFARQVDVAERSVYPGKAKNSIDTLSKEASTVDALEGAVSGIVTACALRAETTSRASTWSARNDIFMGRRRG